MATPLPQRRRVRLPRPLPLVEPISQVDAPFHRSGSFFVRVGGLGVLAVLVFGLLGLRLWSLQVLKGASYGKVALRQSFRTVDLPTARGAIVDARTRLLAGTDGHAVVAVDADALGRVDGQGRWTRFAYEKKAKIMSAEIDPDHKIQLDRNNFNNSHTMEANAKPAHKVGNYWLFLTQWLSQFLTWWAI